MEEGTIKERYLEASVLPRGGKQKDMTFGPGVGCDYSNLDGVITADGTGNTPEIAWQKAFANFSCSLGKCSGARIISLFPMQGKDSHLKRSRDAFESLSKAYGIPITGGQTQVVGGITAPLFTVVLQGQAGEFQPDKGRKEHELSIVMVGYAGALGTKRAISSHTNRERLEKQFTTTFLESAISKLQEDYVLGVVKALTNERLWEKTGVQYLHDVSQGGIYKALWQVGRFFDKGMRVENAKIPMLQETIEISEALDENPYLWDGTGAMLVVCRDGKALLRQLSGEGFVTSVIGKVSMDQERVVLYADGESRTLGPS